MNYKAVCTVALLVTFYFGRCQDITTSLGNISFIDTRDSSEHLKLMSIAKLGACLSQNENKKTHVFLNIRIEKDTPHYYLGYDNIYGLSIKADIYDWKRSDYKDLGIYIGVVDSVFNKEKIITLIEYGVSHLDQLKKLRKKLMKLKDDDKPDNITLSKDEIDEILSEDLSKAQFTITGCDL